MKNAIPIGDKAEYGLEELSDILRIVLSDAQDAYFEVEDLVVPRVSLFDIIDGVLMRISEASLGVFQLLECSPENHQVIYREGAAQKIDAKEVVSDKPYSVLPRNIAATALRLEEITGHLPRYARHEPIAGLVAGIRAEKAKRSS